MRFVWVAVAWVAGIWLAKQANLPSPAWAVGSGTALVAAVLLRKTRASLPLLALFTVLFANWPWVA